MIDRVASDLGRALLEVPVGFKWFVPGLLDGSVGFGGEESAGASFLRFDGTVWTTDKDGMILALLASEILAKTGKTPSQHYAALVERHGDPAYARIDAAANREEKAALAALSPEAVTAETLAGEPITDKLTSAPGNGAKIGGLKVVTEDAWFAARPSGTEDVYKIYAESFRGRDHLAEVQAEAKDVVSAALGRSRLSVSGGNTGRSRSLSGQVAGATSFRCRPCAAQIPCASALPPTAPSLGGRRRPIPPGAHDDRPAHHPRPPPRPRGAALDPAPGPEFPHRTGDHAPNLATLAQLRSGGRNPLLLSVKRRRQVAPRGCTQR